MTKNSLIIGGGSKFGKELTESLYNSGWKVHCISGSDIPNTQINSCTVNWNQLSVDVLEKYIKNLPNLDFIFFNQNSSALSKVSFQQNNYSTLKLWKQEKDWAQAYFNSCILPFHILQSLGDKCNQNSKVAWMLSSLIVKHDNEYIEHADYIGNKLTNYVIMKNFSLQHPAHFFGINPDSLYNTHIHITDFINFINTTSGQDLNGRVYKLSGTIDSQFDKFYNE